MGCINGCTSDDAKWSHPSCHFCHILWHSHCVCSSDKSVRIWDASTGALLTTLSGCTSSVAFSHDGTRIVSGSEDKFVRIWDASTGALLRTLHDHTNDVTSVAFSSDGTCIVSGSSDKSARIWDASTGALLSYGHANDVSSVVPFSDDDTRIPSEQSVALHVSRKKKGIRQIRRILERWDSRCILPRRWIGLGVQCVYGVPSCMGLHCPWTTLDIKSRILDYMVALSQTPCTLGTTKFLRYHLSPCTSCNFS